MEENYENIKVTLLGDSSVGKSSILGRYSLKNKFHISDISSTIGKESFQEFILNPEKTMKISIKYWDTPGQLSLRNVMPNFIRHSNIVVYIFDLTNEESLNNIDTWNELVDEHNNNDLKIVKILVGNKQDLKYNSEMNNTMKEKSKSLLFNRYFKTSALKGENIEELFSYIKEQSSLLVPPSTKTQTKRLNSVDRKDICTNNRCC